MRHTRLWISSAKTKFFFSIRTTKARRWDETAFGVKQWQALCAIVSTTQYALTHAACHCFTPKAVSSHLPSLVLFIRMYLLCTFLHYLMVIFCANDPQNAFNCISLLTASLWNGRQECAATQTCAVVRELISDFWEIGIIVMETICLCIETLRIFWGMLFN